MSGDVLSVINCTAGRSVVSKLESEVRMTEEDDEHLGMGGAERRFDGVEEVEVEGPLPLRYFEP